MYEGNPADLRMVKLISADAVLDEAIHKCQVFKYDMEEDFIYLELKENDLTTISLDAKYRCYIATRNELLCCTGVVKERFHSEDGNMLVFRIENGFYTISDGDGIEKTCKKVSAKISGEKMKTLLTNSRQSAILYSWVSTLV